MLVKNHENKKACNVKKTLVKKGIVLLMLEMTGQRPIMIIDSGMEQNSFDTSWCQRPGEFVTANQTTEAGSGFGGSCCGMTLRSASLQLRVDNDIVKTEPWRLKFVFAIGLTMMNGKQHNLGG